MAIYNKYEWKDGTIYRVPYNSKTGKPAYQGRSHSEAVAKYTGSRANPKITFLETPTVQLLNEMRINPAKPFKIGENSKELYRLKPNNTVEQVDSWDAPVPPNYQYPETTEPFIGEGLFRKYEIKDGEIFRVNYSGPDMSYVVSMEQVGEVKDGKKILWENLSPSALGQLSIAPGMDYIVQGVPQRYTGSGYYQYPAPQTQTPGGDTDDQTGQTPGGSTDDQTGQTPGGSAGNQNNQNYTQIPYINFNDLLRQFEGAIPGYDPNLLQNQQDGGYQLPSGLNESGVDLNTLNAYFLNAYDEARKANIDRWNTAYKGAALNYAQTMQGLQGLGQQEAKEIARNYSLASNAAQNDLIQRGLSATTVKPAVRLGYERQKNEALGRLGERLRRERLGYQNQAFQQIYGALRDRSDVYPDITPYLFIRQGLGNP